MHVCARLSTVDLTPTDSNEPHALGSGGCTGFSEKAVAVGQALIEFNCFCPSRLLRAPLAVRVQEFGRYWDTQGPRTGEAVRSISMRTSRAPAWDRGHSSFPFPRAPCRVVCVGGG